MRVEKKGMEMAYVTKAATLPEEKMEGPLLLEEGESVKSKIKAACATTKVKATIAVAVVIVIAVVVTVGVMIGKLKPPQCKASVVYVASHDDRTVFVIATDKNQVMADIPVGYFPWGVAVTPDGTRAYVTHWRDRTVFVIDTVTNSVSTTILVNVSNNMGLRAVAISPDGTRAYVAHSLPIPGTPLRRFGMLSTIDTVTNQVMSIVPLNNSLGEPYNMVLHPDGTRAYLTGFAAGLVIFDTVKQVVIDAVPVGPTHGIAITPDGTQIYLTSASGSNGTIVVDTTTNQVKRFIPIPSNFSNSVAVSPDGKRAYVVSYNPMNIVTVIDTATNLALEYIPLEPFTDIPGVVVSVDGTRVYVADGDHTVFVIDAATNKVVGDITLHGTSNVGPTTVAAAWIPC
jgi:YVTN family beta-propeller protein